MPDRKPAEVIREAVEKFKKVVQTAQEEAERLAKERQGQTSGTPGQKGS